MMQTKYLTLLAQQLAGPVGVDSFNTELRERRAAVFNNALDPEMIGQLMSLAALEKILDGPDAPLETTDIFFNGHIVRLKDIHHRSNRSVTSVAAEHLAKGATLRVRDIERTTPVLSAFARSVAQVYAAPSQINLYLTPPETAGFPPHFDNTDVFIIQIAGSKKWSLHHEYSNRVHLPDRDVAWDPERFRLQGEVETFILNVGDVLYLPRGAMHSAVCTKEESLHLTISLLPITVAELLQREIQRLSQDEPALRARVQWSVLDDTQESDRVRENMRELVERLAERIDPAQTIADERAALISSEDCHRSSTIGDMLHRLKGEAGRS